MKKYSIILMTLLTLAVGCKKKNFDPSPSSDTPYIGLSLHSSDAETKAMMGSDEILTKGNRFQVYDLLFSTDGSITYENGNPWNNFDAWIDDEIEYDASNTDMNCWPYKSGNTYRWTHSGVHRFFSWLSYDAIDKISDKDLFGEKLAITYPGDVQTNLEATAHSLQTPDVTFTTDSKQFDMLYSSVVSRNMNTENRDMSNIQIFYYHLFSAVSISLTNEMGDADITIKSFSMPNLKNKNNAKLTFASNTDAIVEYGDKEVGDKPFVTDRTNIILNRASGDTKNCYDVLTDTSYTSYKTSQFEKKLIWPQDTSDVAPTNKETDEARKLAGAVYAQTDSLICVNYIVSGTNEDGSTFENEYTKYVKFPKYAWEAGKHYHFNIKFIDKIIELTPTVLPWQYGEYELPYDEWSVSANQLSCTNYAYAKNDADEKCISLANGKAANFKFWIQTPLNGTWTVKLDGDTDVFTVSQSSNKINPNVDGGWVYFSVNGTTDWLKKTRSKEYSVTLSFSVKSGDREMDATSEITNGDVYRIILPTTN